MIMESVHLGCKCLRVLRLEISMSGGLMAPSSHVRYGSYRSHDHYQRQRVLQKERAIVSRGIGLGRIGLAPGS